MSDEKKLSIAAGTNTATFPANTGTVAETNFAQSYSQVQTMQSGMIATGAPPSLLGGVGYGGTTTAAISNCGSLTGSKGCLVINVGGTTSYVPFYYP